MSTASTSSRPSAFDVLMSSATRRSAFDVSPSKSLNSPRKKRKPSPPTQSQASPKKPKTLTPLSTDAKTNSTDLVEDLVVVDEKQPEPSVSISPDESLLELKKTGGNFNLKKAVYWREGERVPFIFVAKALDAINDLGSQNIAITNILCNMLRSVIDSTPDNLLAVVNLLEKRIAPAQEGLELGIGDGLIMKAIAEAYGTTEEKIKKLLKEGDLSLVAKGLRSSQSLMRKPEALTVFKVFDTFRLIAKESGKDSQEKKKNLIKGLLVAAKDCEPQYLIRLLQKNSSIGFKQPTLLKALGHAALYTEKHSTLPKKERLEEAAKIVKQVYSVMPVYDEILPALLSGGVWNLPKTCISSPGIPIQPMLAYSIKSVSRILEKFKNMEFTCEYKYDGERAQIHYMENGSVEIFSRNLERSTGKFPDVVAAVRRLKRPCVTSFVLECELVAYDHDQQRILPFQILSTRARKNVAMDEIKVNVCIVAFDILYLNGQQLLKEQLCDRREHLYRSFQEENGFFQFATATTITSSDIEEQEIEIHDFFYAAVNSGVEGLVVKKWNKDATYEPSKRPWIKLKKDYMDSIGDTLDLVPIGAFYGKGKRNGVYGAFLVACYDSENEEFQSICRVGTGLSDEMLQELFARLASKVIPKPKSYYRYSGSKTPDVWLQPTEVWEVKAADLTISPHFCAAIGIVDPNKGISLRFPRLLRVREDKNIEQATSPDMVADMYKEQAQQNQRDNHQDEDGSDQDDD